MSHVAIAFTAPEVAIIAFVRVGRVFDWRWQAFRPYAAPFRAALLLSILLENIVHLP
jgi:hypothetical protein